MQVNAWIQNGLLYVVRHDAVKSEHAVFTNGGHVVWLPNGGDGSCQALLDIEKHQINYGLPWPPAELPVSM
ncbi:MAG: hypothetical protein OEV29_12745 [Thermoleophilia bacterium]|nr:hypothetical protein [Thermoleophilia bacterium]